MSDETSRLIATAVNHHDELVELLKECIDDAGSMAFIPHSRALALLARIAKERGE